MAAAAPTSAASDAKAGAAAPVSAIKSARGPAEQPPKTTAEEDVAFLKSVTEACHSSTVNRACQALKWYVDSKEVVMNACQALAGLAQDNAKKQGLIQQRGGLTFLIAATLKHAADPVVVTQCFSTLIAVCDQHDANTNAVSKHAIPILMDQLKAHATNVEFVAHALHALDIVCAAASGRKEGAVKGVAPLTIEIMKKHTLVARVQERGSGVLRHIASDATGKKIIAEADGVNFLLGLKKIFPNSSVLDENCTEALKRIQSKDAPQPAAAPAAGAAAAAPNK